MNHRNQTKITQSIAKLREGEHMDYMLMNFNTPIHLKRSLDTIAKHKHVSKTSILNILLESYCKEELNGIIESASGSRVEHDCAREAGSKK